MFILLELSDVAGQAFILVGTQVSYLEMVLHGQALLIFMVWYSAGMGTGSGYWIIGT